MKYETVGIRQLRQDLSVYIERVRGGEILEVTERGRPVALLGPLPGQGTRLEKMVSQGLVTKATRNPATLGMPAGGPRGKVALSDSLGRLRSNER